MLDIGWSELLVIGVVALIVVGPKDLPKLFRTLGRFTGKARGMAREFSRAMNEAADESGMKDLTDSVGSLRKATSARSMGLDALDKAAKSFEDFDLKTETGKLSRERAEKSAKIREHAAKKAQARLDREAAEKAGAEDPAPEAPRPAEPVAESPSAPESAPTPKASGS